MIQQSGNLSTLLISNSDVESLITFEEIINSVEKTWAEHALGRVLNPPKLTLDLGESGNWPQYNSYVNAMPAYVGWLDSAGLKWAGGFWGNKDKKMPSISGLILLVDPRTGRFRAIVDGVLITALRTAAQSIVGMKYLSKKGLKSVGIFGAGTQGRYHALMISKYFPSSEIRVFDIRHEVTKDFVQEMKSKIKSNILACPDAATCSKADVIITLTTSKVPFIKAEWIKEGQTIFALGSYQEICPGVIKKADKIIVDNLQQASHRGALKILSDKGDITEKDIFATIGEIVAGLKPGRKDDKEIIFFEPIGTGMLDVAVATMVYEKAIKEDKGKKFEFLRL